MACKVLSYITGTAAMRLNHYVNDLQKSLARSPCSQLHARLAKGVTTQCW